jgi:prepilin signal peptidase PulO-like enzyme (type II secretory pathway)
MFNDFVGDIHSWIISLHSNEVTLLAAAIGATITLIAAYIAVRTAFKQISLQFEKKLFMRDGKTYKKNYLISQTH